MDMAISALIMAPLCTEGTESKLGSCTALIHSSCSCAQHTSSPSVLHCQVSHHRTIYRANCLHLHGQVEKQKQQRHTWTAHLHANLDGKARVLGSSFTALLPTTLFQYIEVVPTTPASLRTRSESAEEAGESAPQAKDAARKALEQAFQGKMNIFKKWDMEIKNREMAGGDGSGGGSARGGSGGGGGDGDEEGGGSSEHDEPWDWEEAGEVLMATSGLILLYMLITLGPKDTYKLIVFWAKFVLRGFKLRKLPRGYTLESARNSPRPSPSNRDTPVRTQEDRGEADDEGRYLENVKDDRLIMMQQMRLREQRRRRMDEDRDDDF